MGKKGATKNASEIRDEWVALLGKLMDQIEAWSRQAGWETAREAKEITEGLLGTYAAPVVKLRTADGGILYAEPIARDVAGADGRVDVYAWPSLHRLLLVRQGGQWVLKTDSGVEWPQEWRKTAFVSLARNLTKTQ